MDYRDSADRPGGPQEDSVGRHMPETGYPEQQAEKTAPDPYPRDPWAHRDVGMRCHSCMWYSRKDPPAGMIEVDPKGRCRRHAPTMGGYPVVFPSDWCGDHKLV